MDDSRATPVRKGLKYCSPMCGGGCLWSDYQAAVKKAAELATELGPLWAPHVWENMGWHYRAEYGPFAVHPPHYGIAVYSVYASVTGLDGVNITGDTPKAALDSLRTALRRCHIQIMSAIQSLNVEARWSNRQEEIIGTDDEQKSE